MLQVQRNVATILHFHLQQTKHLKNFKFQCLIACVPTIIGLGLFLKMIFCFTNATTSYEVSPAVLFPSSSFLLLSLLPPIADFLAWRSSTSMSSSLLTWVTFFITANGLSRTITLPLNTWWPMIRWGVP